MEDDDSLAPFVDALASALIMMVLVAVFFLIQTATSIAEVAKLITVSDKAVNEKAFTPIVFRKPMLVDYANKEVRYLINFDLTEDQLETIREQILLDNKVMITFYSNDKEKKTAANFFRLISLLKLPHHIQIDTSFEKSESSISRFTWE